MWTIGNCIFTWELWNWNGIFLLYWQSLVKQMTNKNYCSEIATTWTLAFGIFGKMVLIVIAIDLPYGCTLLQDRQWWRDHMGWPISFAENSLRKCRKPALSDNQLLCLLYLPMQVQVLYTCIKKNLHNWKRKVKNTFVVMSKAKLEWSFKYISY